MIYQDQEGGQGNRITVPEGKGWPDGQGNTLPVNQWDDEQRAEVSLYPVPDREPHVPTIDEIREAFRFACSNHIENVLGWSPAKQRSAIAGIYPQDIYVAMKTAIAACITECNRCEDDTTQTPSWPVAPDALSYEEAKSE